FLQKIEGQWVNLACDHHSIFPMTAGVLRCLLPPWSDFMALPCVIWTLGRFDPQTIHLTR
ncbi:MAG: hypothetical protein ABI600_18040, partial [Luteolibacter sp.]